MEIIISVTILTALSWISAYLCYKQRKFYMQHTDEVCGTVISCSKHKEKMSTYRTVYYDLKVKAINGHTYCISTSNRKARKYKLFNNIIVMAPKGTNKYIDFSYPDFSDVLNSNKQPQTPLLYESQNLQLICEVGQKSSETCNCASDGSKKRVIIKDDVKTPFELRLSVVISAILTISSIVITIIFNAKGIV